MEASIPGIAHVDYHTTKTVHRVAVVGGISSVGPGTEMFLAALKHISQTFANLSLIACYIDFAHPKDSGLQPPEIDKFYFNNQQPESPYLWRWLTMGSPDFVIEICESNKVSIETSGFAPNSMDHQEHFSDLDDAGGFLSIIAMGEGDTPGLIPVVRLTCPQSNIKSEIDSIIEPLVTNQVKPSPARIELSKRESRTPLEVATTLGKRYGHKLDQPINYTQGVAISGRLRLSALDNSYPDPTEELVDLLNFLQTPNWFEKNKCSGANLAALCWADDLWRNTNNKNWKNILLKAADVFQEPPDGCAPDPCDPEFRCEDMFYISAIQGRAFQITGDNKYSEMTSNFLLQAETQQENGLFWHSRETPYFWGRGNGFAALGFAEALTYLPQGHSKTQEILQIHKKHLKCLLDFQLPSGMWSQLINFDGSYQELSSTCMIGYALARGIRLGWLDSEFIPALRKSWNAVSKRIDGQANLVDVCTGTGVQARMQDYFYRKAENGYDDRGGSMSLWFATEIEQCYRTLKS